MRVPIVIHQLVHPEDDDTHLESRREREEQDLVPLLEPLRLEVLVQRDEVRRRCRVAALGDVVDEVLRRHAQAGGELAGGLSDRPRRGLVRNEVVDVREAQGALLEGVGQQRRRVLDRDTVDRARLGEHRRARPDLRRDPDAQAAVLRECRESGKGDPGVAFRRALQDRRDACVAQRERGQLLAQDGAHLTRRIPVEARDVLAAHDHAAADGPAADEVVQDEHAGEHARARVRQIEAPGRVGPDLPFDGEAQRRLELLAKAALVLADARRDEHLDVLGLMPRVCQAIARRCDGERERVLAVGADAPLADPRQRFEVDVGMVRRTLEQLAGRQALLRQLQAETLEAARVGDVWAGGPCPPRRASSARLPGHPS